MIGDKNMGKNNGKETRARELFAKEVQEEKANKGWEYNRNLLETSIDSLVTIGPDGIITDVNSATENATGLPREKIIGTDFSEYFTEPDKARVGYKQVFDIGKVVDYELYLKHINGSSIPVSYNASVYKDNEGQIIGVLAVARDISAIKKYEDELIDFKNNLELVVQQKTAKLIIANKELVIQNEEKEKRAAELIIANKELAFQNDEKDKRAAELVLANRELAFQTGEKADSAAELVIADKELVFQIGEKADRAAELVIADEELVFQIGEKADRAAELLIANKELAFQNEEKEKRAAELIIANKELVFQNKEKEKRATELIVANKELAFQNDEKDKRAAELVLANRELAFQTGEKADRAAELVIADKELAFQTGEKADRAAELVIADKELAFQTGEKADRAAELVIADKELAFQTGEKADRAAELVIADKELAFQTGEKADRAAELINANRELIHQNEEKDKRAVELDIANKELFIEREKTEELNNQLESRVTERTAQLESVNKELEAFSYSVSHDLKAPLRHITGYISLLMKKHMNLLPEEGRRYLDNISSSAMNMGELIDGLLQFSRTGRIEMSQKLLDMNQIVDALIQPTREQDQQHRIEFHINPLPPAFGDLEMIKSAWNNLIENAIKFSKKKDLAKISIGAEENETEIIYYIKDNGAGFDMNYAAKLFTAFQRLHSREDFEGTGIGLATVQRIITRHGGSIWAESKVGEGAAFFFTLIKRKER